MKPYQKYYYYHINYQHFWGLTKEAILNGELFESDIDRKLNPFKEYYYDNFNTIKPEIKVKAKVKAKVKYRRIYYKKMVPYITLYHPQHGFVTGTRKQLSNQYKLSLGHLSSLLKGILKQTKGFILIKP